MPPLSLSRVLGVPETLPSSCSFTLLDKTDPAATAEGDLHGSPLVARRGFTTAPRLGLLRPGLSPSSARALGDRVACLAWSPRLARVRLFGRLVASGCRCLGVSNWRSRRLGALVSRSTWLPGLFGGDCCLEDVAFCDGEENGDGKTSSDSWKGNPKPAGSIHGLIVVMAAAGSDVEIALGMLKCALRRRSGSKGTS